MGVYINNLQLLPGKRYTFAGIPINTIRFNNSLVYEYDNSPPSLTITSPTSGSDVTKKSGYIISGDVSDSASGIRSVTINGNSVSVSGGHFDISAPADSTMEIVATDNAGNSSSKTITRAAGRQYSTWIYGETSPGDGDVTVGKNARCSVCGKTYNWRVWRNNGDYQSGDTPPTYCPNGHYKYKITIS